MKSAVHLTITHQSYHRITFLFQWSMLPVYLPRDWPFQEVEGGATRPPGKCPPCPRVPAPLFTLRLKVGRALGSRWSITWSFGLNNLFTYSLDKHSAADTNQLGSIDSILFRLGLLIGYSHTKLLLNVSVHFVLLALTAHIGLLVIRWLRY